MSRSAFATTASCANPATLSGSAFEIDVNANLKVDTTGCIDWLAGGTGTSLRTGVLSKDDKTSGSGDDSFGQGTSENDANPTIVDGSIPPNKSDLKKFGVYTETSGTSKFLALFWTRINSPQGTTNMDFELNQKFCNPAATPTNCANNGSGVTPETPIRTIGDKLITYDLSKGGTVPTISIRTWTGTAWSAATVISGGANPQALGSVNTSSIAAADSGGIGALDPFTFGEAVLNFNALFPPGSACGTFGSAYLKSRSSDSFSAELKDFIAPEQVNITNCTSLVTNATASVTIGSSIKDTATISGATANAGGTITFKAYSDASCSTLVFTSNAIAVNGNGNYDSNSFTPTAVGTYYWTASYTGDPNNAPSSSACGDANESSVVSKAQPAIVTTAFGPVTIGSSIHDTATLSGGVTPTGSITFRAYSDSGCTTQVFTDTVTVSGNGNYDSGNFTPSAAGSYYWVASYSGDAKNEAASTACGDANETSVVNKAQPGIVTTASGPVTIGSSIHDTATLSGGVSPTGSITFRAYSDSNCSTQVFTDTVTVNGNGNYDSANFTPTAVGSYYWVASYGGDGNNEAAATACGDPNETSVVNKASSNVATVQRLFPQDKATVSASAGGTPTGSVTFKLYGPNDTSCGGSAVYTETVALSGGEANTANTTFSVVAGTSGVYRWIVTYSGDATHEASTSACGTEQFTATITNS